MEAGLPLGIVPAVEYPESVTHGERFTFDRTCDISTQSAQQIANAAQDWGQNDDITVVTVWRNA